MKLSQQGFELIKKFEGCRLVAYKPVGSEEYYTIGYGHYGKDVSKGERITQDKADQLLEDDLKRFEAYVNSVVKVPLSQGQYDAMVSFTYNVGEGNLLSSTLLKLLNEKKYEEAANEFPKWVHDNGQVLQGLVRRREAEKALFLKQSPKPKTTHPKGYVIKQGDNLTKIAKKYHTSVSHLMDLNPQLENKNLIVTGHVLNVPLEVEHPTALKDYEIVKGDNLTSIAKRFNTSVKHLMLINPQIENKNKIFAGKIIKVPNR